MKTMLRSDADRFSELTEQLLNLLSLKAGRIDALSLSKRQDEATALLGQLDQLERQVQNHVRLAKEHRADHDRIKSLQRTLSLRDQRIQAALAHLAFCQTTLADLTLDASTQLDQIQRAEKRMSSPTFALGNELTQEQTLYRSATRCPMLRAWRALLLLHPRTKMSRSATRPESLSALRITLSLMRA